MGSGKSSENIVIKGARVNNLKDITLEIPRGKFVVITGLSGSGKSSLAFDTLYAEGQRRFAESLSSYARQFLGRMSKPDVDMIEGIPPAVAIEQRVNIKNPRSTVATSTEIYDYIRLLFARIGRCYSPVSGKEVKLDDNDSVVNSMLEALRGHSNETGSGFQEPAVAYILANLNWKGRTDHVELMLSLKEQGYTRFFDPSEGTVYRIEQIMQMTQDCPDDLWLLVDRIKFDETVSLAIADSQTVERQSTDNQSSELKITDNRLEDLKTRLWSSVQDAFDRGNGRMGIWNGENLREFSNRFEADGIVFTKPDEYLFSFNSPLGACPVCGGLGKIDGISEDLVVPNKSISIYDGAIAAFRGEKMGRLKDLMCRNGYKYGLDVFKPYCLLTEKEKDIVWNGIQKDNEEESIVGVFEFFRWVETQRYKTQFKFMMSRYTGRTTCHECEGSRLRKEALWVRIGDKNIKEVLGMTVGDAVKWLSGLKLDQYEQQVAERAIQQVKERLGYLMDVGLQYLTLDRASNTLSGGEAQRISLVTALGSCLVGSLYILDEPSIGLHSRDTERLIGVLKKLRDIGNTVVVVEHDEEIMRAADQIIDLGPGAGKNGGKVVFQGQVSQAAANDLTDRSNCKSPASGTFPSCGDSLTVRYLNGSIPRFTRKKLMPTHFITIEGAREHNLKNIDVRIPLECMTVVCGVSGSGKSTLTGDILFPALKRHLEQAGPIPGTHKCLSGDLKMIDEIEYVDQSPVGRSTRSNAVTYLKIYDDIRKLLAEQQYAKISGYTPSFFSFNQDGGRCPECQGEGIIHIPMQFMSDVTMVCEQCGGKRFKADVLQVRYDGKNVDDILEMSVDEAIEFFGSKSGLYEKSIASRLKFIAEVGLGYIKLGQSSSTLSGGESQRLKLAYSLSMSTKKRIMFIFDEPTTGLHFKDVEILLHCFERLVEHGHSVVVVEHNTDVIRSADYMIDLGPDAGDKGGEIVYAGAPENCPKDTNTGRFLFTNN